MGDQESEGMDFISDSDDVFGECNDLPMVAECSDLNLDSNFFEDFLKGTGACSHRHTCNPPGPSTLPHTHTCVHTHTRLFAQQETGDSESLKTLTLTEAQKKVLHSPTRKRPIGNREAVKKYREKKKAHIACLEQQVKQLRTVNQQLIKRLQAHTALEAEVSRLRTVLAEFRGRIDGELGIQGQKLGIPHDARLMQHLPGGYVLNSFSVPCGVADVPCLHPATNKEMISSPALQDSALSCGYPANSCRKKPETRKKLSAKALDCRSAGQ